MEANFNFRAKESPIRALIGGWTATSSLVGLPKDGNNADPWRYDDSAGNLGFPPGD